MQLERAQLSQAGDKVTDDPLTDGVRRLVGDRLTLGHGQQLAAAAGGRRLVVGHEQPAHDV